ncbi:MAG TPA: hypothetical protein VJK03_00610 [Candidatus Nanoarchaeia archaeon]|nr:hypothetical protein [Candidatus Nanoarchaeia archaeon]
METKKEAVANATTLIYLSKLGIFHLARNLFSRIFIPSKVMEEITANNYPETLVLKKEISYFLKEVNANAQPFPIGEGERAAISYCLEKGIKLFLSDDKKARKFAYSLGLEAQGVLGIIFENLDKNKIKKDECRLLVQKLVNCNYYISSQLYAEVMKKIDRTNGFK